MLVQLSGTRDGVEWPPIGGVLVCPDQEAADLAASGYAVAVAKAAPVVERADVAPAAETADVAPKAPKRPR
jgi:hypothetical protein